MRKFALRLRGKIIAMDVTVAMLPVVLLLVLTFAADKELIHA